MKTYHPASRSGRDLARRLGLLRLRTPSRYRPRNTDVIINWGSSDCFFLPMTPKVINKATAVRAATHKCVSLAAFTKHGVPCPEWTTERDDAQAWLAEGSTVVGRSLTRGSGGRGISLFDGGDSELDELPDLPLYTKYVKKRDEYRVFVVNDTVIRITQKRSRRGNDPDYRIRNASNGWVYCHEGVVTPQVVHWAGREAVRVLGLDFGAVDVGYNAHYKTACVYEVNTAFGLEGTTLEVFANALEANYLGGSPLLYRG